LVLDRRVLAGDPLARRVKTPGRDPFAVDVGLIGVDPGAAGQTGEQLAQHLRHLPKAGVARRDGDRAVQLQPGERFELVAAFGDIDLEGLGLGAAGRGRKQPEGAH
jgi:hypothetical protein